MIASPNGLRAVLFDFDGTLTPSLPLWLEAYHIALRSFSVTLPDAEVLLTFGEFYPMFYPLEQQPLGASAGASGSSASL